MASALIARDPLPGRARPAVQGAGRPAGALEGGRRSGQRAGALREAQPSRPTLAGFLDDVAAGRPRRRAGQGIATRPQRHRADDAAQRQGAGVSARLSGRAWKKGCCRTIARSAADGAAIDEERRLCYVGITRARPPDAEPALTRMKWGKPRPTMPSRFLVRDHRRSRQSGSHRRGQLIGQRSAPRRLASGQDAKQALGKQAKPATADQEAASRKQHSAGSNSPDSTCLVRPNFAVVGQSALSSQIHIVPIFLSWVNCPVAGCCVARTRRVTVTRGRMQAGYCHGGHDGKPEPALHPRQRFSFRTPARAGRKMFRSPLRDVFLDAPFRAAERVFDAALREQVDFVLLAGDFCRPMAAGPRALVFLVEQFERLHERNVPIYWATGRADAAHALDRSVALAAERAPVRRTAGQADQLTSARAGCGPTFWAAGARDGARCDRPISGPPHGHLTIAPGLWPPRRSPATRPWRPLLGAGRTASPRE